MTDFLLHGKTADGDERSLEEINEAISDCIDWTALRKSRITLGDASPDELGAPPVSWTGIADPHQTEIVFSGLKVGADKLGMLFMDVYQSESPYNYVLNGITKHHLTNAGDLVITLLDHVEPWLIRVTAPAL